MRLAVLEARLLYPVDAVLEQLENTLEQRQSLGHEEMRSLLDELNTRLAELYAGH